MPRLFIALRPPEAVRDILIDTMEALDGARWQEDDNLHLTLRFIGEVDRPLAEDIATALTRIAFAPFRVELAGIGHFERKGRPHALWARVLPSPALAALHLQVEQACRSAGCAVETRVFTPHVTIARINSATAPIGGWLARHNTLSASWQAEGFGLYESRLLRSGAAYEEIVHYPASSGKNL